MVYPEKISNDFQSNSQTWRGKCTQPFSGYVNLNMVKPRQAKARQGKGNWQWLAINSNLIESQGIDWLSTHLSGNRNSITKRSFSTCYATYWFPTSWVCIHL